MTFQRPNLPYANQPLPNDSRYQNLSNVGRPPTAQMIDGDFDYVIDSLNALQAAIDSVVAGNIPGSNDPRNANKLLSTDGKGNLPWTSVDSENISDGAILTQHLGAQVVASGNIQNQAVGNAQLAPQAISFDKIAPSYTGGVVVTDANGLMEVTRSSTVGLPLINNGFNNVATYQQLAAAAYGNQSIPSTAYGNNSIPGTAYANGSITLNKLAQPITVPYGGTGLNTLTTSYGIICAGTTPTGNLQNAGTGSARQIYISNGNNALGTWGSIYTLLPAAVAGDQRTGTSTTAYINPAVQQFHISACKAWVIFDAISGGVTIYDSYNIASVVNGGGEFTVTFTIPFATANYCVTGTCGWNTAGQECFVVIRPGSLATNRFMFRTVRYTDGAVSNAQSICIQVFGRQ